jgi:hypothetical protein
MAGSIVAPSMPHFPPHVWLGIAVALIGSLTVITGAPPFSRDCDSSHLREGASYTSHQRLWPPGAIECEYRSPTGTLVTEVDFPLTEWITVGVGAAGFALMTSAFGSAVRRRIARFATGCLLILAALVLWFVGLGPGLLAAAIVVLPLGWSLRG